jgi:F420-dependent oxidoreductase-like protein
MTLPAAAGSVAALVEAVVHYQEVGLDAVWSAQLFGVDALTVFALAGEYTADIRFGTAVIPTYSRHPLSLASQALTTQAATGGRLRLGIGSSHRALVEGVLGADYDRPAAYLREYLTVLPRILRGERFRHEGPRLTVDTTEVFGRAVVPGAEPPPIFVGTMFPISLGVAGRLADGVVTWLVGPRTMDTEVLPTVGAAAASVGRSRPRVIAGIPISLCRAGDTEAQEDLVNRALGRFTALPVYERVLAREGATCPAELGAIGDEADVLARLDAFAEAGVDEVYGVCFGDEETRLRTAALLGSLGASSITARPHRT